MTLQYYTPLRIAHTAANGRAYGAAPLFLVNTSVLYHTLIFKSKKDVIFAI